MSTPISLSFILAVSLLAPLFAWWAKAKISKAPAGSAAMREISKAIEDGSRAYLKRQYRSVAWVAAVLVILIYAFFGWITALGFLIGAVASALAGFLGMMTAVFSNSRVAEAAKRGLEPAFQLAFL
ncbi:MAG: sodium/proton-translocating pyrophosphatase, partial [Patescibacteria group bacterium]